MALNKLRMEIGRALAEGRMHTAVSRELMIWLGCYDFQELPVLSQPLQYAMLEFCEKQHLTAMRDRCPYISGVDAMPWAWVGTAEKRLIALCSYYTASEQDILAAGLFKKIAEMRELTNH